MRREVVRVAVTAVWIALAVLVTPLGVAVFLLVRGEERAELERTALRAAIQVDAGFAAGDPVELPPPPLGNQLGLYDPAGALHTGTGPTHADPAVRQALTGAVSDQQSDGMLVVTVPVTGGERVTGVIRSASPLATVWQRAALAWAGLAALAGAALTASVLVARRRARRLAAPLETLALASRAVGNGDFTIRVPPCGITELDHVAITQNLTADRLGALLERERQFTANASHQLRTPLAGLRLGLETALQNSNHHPDHPGHLARTEPGTAGPLEDALATTRRLQATIEDVLALHRPLHPAGADPTTPTTETLGAMLRATSARWTGPLAASGRRLTYSHPTDLAERPLPQIRTEQILDILLDNALLHGTGRVHLDARTTGTATAIDVSDEGPGIPDTLGDIFHRGTGNGTGHGIGLSLARDFATTLNGRLLLTSRTPPVFTLFLPAPEPAPEPAHDAPSDPA